MWIAQFNLHLSEKVMIFSTVRALTNPRAPVKILIAVGQMGFKKFEHHEKNAY